MTSTPAGTSTIVDVPAGVLLVCASERKSRERNALIERFRRGEKNLAIGAPVQYTLFRHIDKSA